MVHLIGSKLVCIAIAVLQSVFVGPHVTGQGITMEIFLGGGFYLLNRMGMVFDRRLFFGNRLFLHLLRLGFVNHLHLVLTFDLFRGKSGVFPRFDDLVIWIGFRLNKLHFLKAAKQVSLKFLLSMI